MKNLKSRSGQAAAADAWVRCGIIFVGAHMLLVLSAILLQSAN